ncbi:mandelate racemase/muconate lactonizing enzyme family protein [Rhodococcus sp. T2V]|uniref:mandelate racemase/muconate lactonizing enzyme family protein n=1 Tax=Rhodococcus sp. T2V TaxID=3034164 RepID=UPI0023E28992|nr:mandelate racemase/muconate lactonizing enzyme family protein [Rhodococcus sp. T2V]MDF3305327.1 mandelate racemase/muconate lactonizing enzyme family protein [Rhodococcus sp. T2V]
MTTKNPHDRPVVARVESFALEHALPDGGYGTAKGLVSSRVCTLVKITTSDGVEGWGECYGVPELLTPYLSYYGRALLGVPVDAKENFVQQVVAHSYHLSTGGLHIAALSGLDIALWDAQARGFGVSIGDLLGGVVRTTVPAYASIGYVTRDGDLDEFRGQIQGAADEGFTAAKIKIGTGLRADRQRSEITLDVLGPDGELMVDYNANATADVVLRSLRALADLEPGWAEEPLPPYQRDGWDRVREAGIPIAAGESLYTRFGFRDPIADGRMDIVQPDVTKCGGFTEAKLITQMAYTWNRRVSPHCWGTGVAEAACLQLLSTLPDSPYGDGTGTPQYLEFDRGYNPLREAVLTKPIRLENGLVAVPAGPGLGITLAEGAIRKLAIAQLSVDIH